MKPLFTVTTALLGVLRKIETHPNKNIFCWMYGDQEMRAEFNKAGLLLTAAVGASLVTINKAYDIPTISQYLDFIHVMGYDYHGSWDALTGHNAPLKLQANSSSLAPELRLSLVWKRAKGAICYRLSYSGLIWNIWFPLNRMTPLSTWLKRAPHVTRLCLVCLSTAGHLTSKMPASVTSERWRSARDSRDHTRVRTDS